MSNFDTISASFKLAWSDSAFTPLLPASHVYYGRAEQPDQLAGFPYVELNIIQDNFEVMTVVEDLNSLATYILEVKVYTCQGMTGGNTSGDQITDQGNLQRALDSILNFLVPNNPWNYVTEFLHCLKQPSVTLEKDPELYLGGDVYISKQSWKLLISE